jgi:hypothetical protein
MDFATLVQNAAELLGAQTEQDEETHYLTVFVSTGDGEGDGDEDEQGRLVTVHEEGEDAEIVIVASEVGPYAEELDLPRVLMELQSVVFARVYIGPPDEEGSQPMIVEAGLPRPGLSGETLAEAIQEVADLADGLEELFYAESEADTDVSDE